MQFLATLGIKLPASGLVGELELYKPYANPAINFLYNLLFCDDLCLFKKNEGAKAADIWGALLAEQPDRTALRKIADDEANEGRVRAIAYNRLRTIGEAAPLKKLLGVIAEVALQGGLDVLAAFSEGGVRYLKFQLGKGDDLRWPSKPGRGPGEGAGSRSADGRQDWPVG